MGKSLTESEVGRLKTMALQGYTPATISKDLGCAISTVHHYKDKLRKELGLQFPTVKGKRPTELPYPEPATPSTSRAVAGFDTKHVRGSETTIHPVQQPIQFVVNGVTVQVAPGAKSIEIGNNVIHINF
jgi:hypothetical protein